MPSEVDFLVSRRDSSREVWVGNHEAHNVAVARGACPFCDIITSFRQIGDQEESKIHGRMVACRCDACHSIVSIRISDGSVYLAPRVSRVNDLPEEINKYYQEAIRCIAADGPNGAVTLFRKVIHALALHYEIAEKGTTMSIYDMVNKLDEEGKVCSNLRRSLLDINDIGNDGAHINNNEPDIEQAMAIE